LGQWLPGDLIKVTDRRLDGIARQLVETDRDLAVDLTAYLHSAHVLQKAGVPMGARLLTLQRALRKALLQIRSLDEPPVR
jgi:hypothetical protein